MVEIVMKASSADYDGAEALIRTSDGKELFAERVWRTDDGWLGFVHPKFDGVITLPARRVQFVATPFDRDDGFEGP